MKRGDLKLVGVKYEWKPTLCAHCKGLGHVTDECKKREPKKSEWVVKKKEEVKKQEEKDEDGFVKVMHGVNRKGKEIVNSVIVENAVDVLSGDVDKGETNGEGGGPSHGNG